MSNSDIVRGAYAAFEVGDVPGVLGVLADDIEWIDAFEQIVDSATFNQALS